MTWIELNRSNLEHNVNQYKSWMPANTMIAPVIKANAYGHGIFEIASMHEHNSLINKLCVVNTQEALHLRKHNIKKNILVLSYINSPIEDVIHNNLEITVSDIPTLHMLNKTAINLQTKVKVHLKIDTGMSRLGIFPHEITTYLNEIKQLPGLQLIGLCSHLSSSNNKKIVLDQEKIFKPLLQHNIPEIHIANSLGSLKTTHNYSFSRIGIGLYGYLLTTQSYQKQLKPVLSLKTKIFHIKHLQTNTHVGYKQIYTTSKPTKIAVIAIGYHDGLNPNLINGGKVIVHNQYAPLISINMNVSIIDISHIKECKIYDEVTILGEEKSCKLSAYDWQKVLKTNIRELLARLETSLPRIILDNKTQQLQPSYSTMPDMQLPTQ